MQFTAIRAGQIHASLEALPADFGHLLSPSAEKV
jgi:hypothetical protein